MSQAMSRVGQRAYLYYFTYAESGKRARLGAYHGEELKFLSGSFPADWEHSRDDEMLGEIMRKFWAQFAKTGNPNALGIPKWPAYDARSAQCLELGRRVCMRPVKPQLLPLERIMHQVLDDVSGKTSETGISRNGKQ